MKVLILGADGFLGSFLTKRLIKEGHEVTAFDRFRDGETINLSNLTNKIKMLPGDFLNQNDLQEATKGQDLVFHFISTTTPASSGQNPTFDVLTNINGTINLLKACVDNNVKRVIFASSGGTIYGDHEREKFAETDSTLPISPYGISKLAIERYLEYFKLNYGLDYLVFRYSNPYGPHQNKIGLQGVLPIFMNKLLNKESITVFGDGQNIRDYIYIDDLIDMTAELLNKEQQNFSVYNIGSSQGVSLSQIIKEIERVSAQKFIINNLPARSFDVKKVVLDTNRIFSEIPTRQLISLSHGIEKLWTFFKK